VTDTEPATLMDELMTLLRAPSTCYITTLMPDGSPQLTQTWVDTDGEHILINTVVGFQKLRNIERDPRVAVAVADPAHPARYISVRGRVTATTTDHAADTSRPSPTSTSAALTPGTAAGARPAPP
jgi:PPOX class probable F420-dependent enzyme